MSKSIIQEKSFLFAIRIVDLYKQLKEQREFVLSKQILRSGTSIGANVSEAVHGQSMRDFAAKMHISRKEANETLYWLELLESTGYISESDASGLKKDCKEIQRILASIIITARQRI